jgi:hypothetical protein
MYLGLVILGVGGIVYFFGDNLSWFGKLPGDIRIEKENMSIYFPLTTMIIISVIINLIIRLFNFFK